MLLDKFDLLQVRKLHDAFDNKYLEAKLGSYTCYLTSVVTLDTANTDERITTLSKSFWNQISIVISSNSQ